MDWQTRKGMKWFDADVLFMLPHPFLPQWSSSFLTQWSTAIFFQLPAFTLPVYKTTVCKRSHSAQPKVTDHIHPFCSFCCCIILPSFLDVFYCHRATNLNFVLSREPRDIHDSILFDGVQNISAASRRCLVVFLFVYHFFFLLTMLSK